jgi:hypothetical protein
MAQKIKTSQRALHDGVQFRDKVVELRFPPLGHLSVELRDASGRERIGPRTVSYVVPGLGKIETPTDDSGYFLQRDVPFADYEITVSDAGVIKAPAVASPAERHFCAVPGAKLAWADLEIVDPRGFAVADTDVRIAGQALRTDRAGVAVLREPLDGKGKTTITVGDVDLELGLPAEPRRMIVMLPPDEEAP